MASNDETEAVLMDDETEDIINYMHDADTICTICSAEFLDPDDLKIHLDQVHKIASAILRKCHFCVEEYSDLMNYAEHLRDCHISTLKSCPKCWRVFDDFDAHRSHCRKHVTTFDYIFSCSQCKQRYADLTLLKEHEFEHKTNREGIILHEVLPYLSAVLKMKSMNFLEALDTDAVLTCVGCDFSTVDMDTYLRHVRSNECKIYVCHKCSSVFKMKRNLSRHVIATCNMFGIRERRSQYCNDCFTYIDVQKFRKHKITCKPIKCYTCDITFASMNDWSEHQSTEHSGISVEVETCKFCWKRCVGSVAMKKHIEKIHKPEFHMYKYLCVYCNSVFKHPQKLFGHFVTKHKDIFPYTCRICDKTFRYRKKFTIHIKLTHKSIGFVEFDKNYHVFFTDKKSEDPFIPKSIYVEEMPEVNMRESNCLELNSDFMNVTETEGNQTEAEIKEKAKLKRKRTSNLNKEDNSKSINIDSSDDDEPLLLVRKRVRLQKKKGSGRKKRGQNKELLTCNICNKYCYTFQNYNHHISLHSKHEVKKCIKCSKIFRSKSKLNEHIANDHSSSKLTDTLKTLLEKRKTGGSLATDVPSSIKFRHTIKKVKTEVTATSATITEVDHKLSVQKFFENFVPEENKVENIIDTPATIRLVKGYNPRKMIIKITKFKPSPITTSHKLSMPVKFVDNNPQKTKLTIKLVEQPAVVEETHEYYADHYDESNDMDRHESIPEVAEEVLLEGTEETPKLNQSDFAHKIVIPKLPTELTDIRIAHLLPQAPYYKIVKVKDVLDQSQEEKDDSNAATSFRLADGTKLVTTNPLAHLLGKEQDKVLQSVKSKYYKPKNRNLQVMLAKALTLLDKPSFPKKRNAKHVPQVKSDDD